MPTPKFNRWFHGLASAVITGGCSAGLASLGIQGANMVGIKIQAMNLQQLGAVVLSGGIVGCMAYLMKSPLPPDGDETYPAKPNTRNE